MRYVTRNTIHGMGENKSIRSVLWANVRALMINRYGEENLNRLAREAKLGPGTASRIKEARTSVGLNVIDKIARTFGVEPWQLIAPGMDDEKFLDVLKAWQDTDGRGRRMLLSAAAGAAEHEDQGERPSGRAVRS